MSSGQSTTPGVARPSQQRLIDEAIYRIEQIERQRPLPTITATGTVEIPPISLQIIATWSPPDTTDYQTLDWSTATILGLETNDPLGLSSRSTITDPFTGEWFKIDWTADPTIAVDVIRAGVYVWVVRFDGTFDGAVPPPAPYTVMCGCNQAAQRQVFYHGDPGWEGPPTGAGNWDFQHSISGVQHVEPSALDRPWTIQIGSTLSDWSELQVLFEIVKVADFRDYDLDIDAVAS